MGRNITVTFDDGSSHIYNGVPDNVTPEMAQLRAEKDFTGRKVTGLDGGAAAKEVAAPIEAAAPAQSKGPIASTVDYVGELSRNILPGMGKVVGAVAHPFDTFNQLVGLGAGALQNISPKVVTDMVNKFEFNPEAAKAAVAQANAVGGEYAKNYGSIEGFLNHLKTDPVAVVADFSGLTGVAGKAASSPTLSNISAMTNPVAPVIAGATGTANLGIRGYNASRGYADKVLDSKGNALRTAVKGKGEEIVNALRGNTELVSGSLPTAGEAAAAVGSTGYAKLQKDTAKTLADDYLARDIANAKARDIALGEVGGTEAGLTAAREARTTETAPMYAAAEEGAAKVDTAKVLGNIDVLINKSPGNPALLAQLEAIKSGLLTKDGSLRTSPVEISSSIDGIKAALKVKENSHIKDVLTNIKQDLMDSVPGYKEANARFAELSKPINEMEVGQQLQKDLKSSLRNETPGSFTAAVENEAGTIKAATDSNRYTKLTEVLSPENKAKVDAVKEDFLRQEQNKQIAKRGETVELAPNVRTSGVLSRVATLADKLLRAIEGKISRATAIEIAKEMLDPKLAATSLEKAISKKERIPMGLIKRRVPPAIILNNLAPANQNNLGASE
jgi:hypothetical protein